ncbi:hypothetical protein MUK42_29500 [Musa troglodytarum]|uniref:Uncharacterized protein n=1 Tax=Musa troglodytarum TaxID=320322 RepID=A0A9E7JUL5_9LILI|nr:hypothetical protein MUK42_29500 [Musa troglodytarum]
MLFTLFCSYFYHHSEEEYLTQKMLQNLFDCLFENYDL